MSKPNDGFNSLAPIGGLFPAAPVDSNGILVARSKMDSVWTPRHNSSTAVTYQLIMVKVKFPSHVMDVPGASSAISHGRHELFALRRECQRIDIAGESDGIVAERLTKKRPEDILQQFARVHIPKLDFPKKVGSR